VKITPPVSDGDVSRLRELLEEASLPLDGLLEVPTTVLIAREAGEVVGGGALEEHGSYGLLRSLVVARRSRGRGVGTELVSGLEDAGEHLEEIYLLTETAPDFFVSRGYQPIERDSAPDSVRASIEWSVACGDSAVAMRLSRRRTET
jgi:amino-acid N-acetyltransferase